MSHIKSKLAILLILVSISATPKSQKTPSNPEVLLRGRIVRFDWVLHETTLYDDFVVRTLPEENGEGAYVRIYWVPKGGQGWESPPLHTPHLNRLSFVNIGPPWLFSVRRLTSVDCPGVPADPELQDESGKRRIPRYFATPGAEGEVVPPINALPCFRLMEPMTQEKD